MFVFATANLIVCNCMYVYTPSVDTIFIFEPVQFYISKCWLHTILSCRLVSSHTANLMTIFHEGDAIMVNSFFVTLVDVKFICFVYIMCPEFERVHPHSYIDEHILMS